MNTPAKTRVIAGLSGGVDSAVAALLLLEAGYDVQGLFMQNWDDADSHCTAAQDYQDARAVARDLGIVLHRVNFEQNYRREVFAQFLDEYRAGRTPNPDVLCNRQIKFGACLDYARRLGARRFATGHYARTITDVQGTRLLKGRDPDKDQSYFLHQVPREVFAEVLFPIGDLTKAEVRERARNAGLAVADKPDSTGICFIGERPFAEFLGQYLPETPGAIESLAGVALGTHRGLPFYTLGQRSGIGVGGARGAAAEPWYVARKDGGRNVLVVAQRHELEALGCHALRTVPMNWLEQPGSAEFSAVAKIRYRQPDQDCRVLVQPDGSVELRFAQPQRAVTPGQYAVLYRSDLCLGGGVIAETL
jgi:tRNA-uridine 2-sulfurtransferase